MYCDMMKKPVFLNQCGIRSCNSVKILLKWVYIAELHLINFRENVEFISNSYLRLNIKIKHLNFFFLYE